MRDYIELTKPRITWLILMSTAIGYYFGLSSGWNWLVLFHALMGTGLMASGTATLNEWYERDADALMRRTFPHFLSIAWLYREDYGRAGIKMLPVVEPDGRSTARQILTGAALLIPVSLAPTWLNMTGSYYLVGAAALGAMFLYSGIKVAQERTPQRARRVLLASVVYLPLLYGLMVADGPASKGTSQAAKPAPLAWLSR